MSDPTTDEARMTLRCTAGEYRYLDGVGARHVDDIPTRAECDADEEDTA